MSGISYKATEKDIKQLIALWKECFTTDTNYLTNVFTKLFPNCDIYVYSINGEILSSLFLINIKHIYIGKDGNNIIRDGKYLYGVCTKSTARGKGYSRQLLEEAIQFSVDSNEIDFLITRPATPSLVEFYRAQKFISHVPRGTIAIPYHLQGFIDERVFAEQLYNLIKDLYKNRFEWNTDMLEYMFTLGEFHQFFSDQTQEDKEKSNEIFALVRELKDNILDENIYLNSFFNFPME